MLTVGQKAPDFTLNDKDGNPVTLSSFIGKEIDVLCDGIDYEKGCFVGRAYFNAPDIDGKVYFRAPRRVKPGTFVKVKVEDMLDYDVIGTQIVE